MKLVEIYRGYEIYEVEKKGRLMFTSGGNTSSDLDQLKTTISNKNFGNNCGVIFDQRLYIRESINSMSLSLMDLRIKRRLGNGNQYTLMIL